MKRRMLRFVWVGSAVLLGGCITPQNTRLPTLAYGDPRAESNSYMYHDPLGYTEPGGNSSGARPRGYDVPRTEARRTMDHASDPTLPFPLGGSSDSSSNTAPSGRKYQQSVSP